MKRITALIVAISFSITSPTYGQDVPKENDFCTPETDDCICLRSAAIDEINAGLTDLEICLATSEEMRKSIEMAGKAKVGGFLGGDTGLVVGGVMIGFALGGLVAILAGK